MFEFAKATFYNPNYITITWRFSPEDINNSFSIYYSENPEKNFRELITLPGDSNNYSTSIINLHSETRVVYFRIKCTTPDGEELLSDIFSNSRNQDIRIPAFIMEQMALELKRFNGIPTLYYQKRTIGEHCPDCWDPIAKRSTKSKCTTCYNTGIYKGYYDPILIYVNYTPESHNKRKAVVGTADTIGAQGWTVAYPIITPGSVLIELTENANRWEVKAINFTELYRIPLKQMLSLGQLPRGSVEWKLPSKDIQPCEEQNIWREIWTNN